jgi:actin-like ATPase involved in cell morphogenesis
MVKKFYLIHEPMAAAIGIGIDIMQTKRKHEL